MFERIASPEAWIALATLTALETVLGIDNIRVRRRCRETLTGVAGSGV